MKTTKEERQNCRAIISRKYPLVYTYDYRLWSFIGRLLDDIEELENELSKDREVFLKIIERTN